MVNSSSSTSSPQDRLISGGLISGDLISGGLISSEVEVADEVSGSVEGMVIVASVVSAIDEYVVAEERENELKRERKRE